MKTNKYLLLQILFITIVLAGCGQKNSNSDNSSDASNEKKKGQSQASEGCYSQYIENICSLISPKEIADIIGISSDQVSTRDNSKIHGTSNPGLISCIFETPSGSGYGTVTVGQIKKEDANIFKTKYNNEYYHSNGREAEYIQEYLGDAAVCLLNSGNTILTVLVNDESFIVQIYGNSKSHRENQETAIKIAREILKKC